MARLGNEMFNEFIRVLSTQNKDERLVAYYGIGEVLATHLSVVLNSDTTSSVLKGAIHNIVDKIGEYAIIDRDIMEKAITDAFMIKNYRYTLEFYKESAYSINTYNDINGISRYLGNDKVDLINNNIQSFRYAITTTANIIDDLI